jgi:hypothetical protein
MTDLLQIILMAVALEDGQHLAGCFEDFSHVGVVLDTVVVAHVEPLVSKDNHRLVVGLEIAFQPLDLRSRNVGVGPVRVLPAIRLAIAAEAGIQHDKVEAAPVERKVRLLLLNAAQELLFLQRVHAVVPQDVMPVFADRRELSIDRLEVTLLHVHRVLSVDEVTEFHQKRRLILLELRGSFFEFGQRLPIVPSSSRCFVGVVQIGHESYTQTGSFVIGEQFRCASRSGCQQERPVLQKGSSSDADVVIVAGHF